MANQKKSAPGALLQRVGRISALTAALLTVGPVAAAWADGVMRGDGPPPASTLFSITKADPALDGLIDPNAKAEILASGFGLTEGPLWVPDGGPGYLLVTGLLDNVIYKITPNRKVSVFLDQAGYTGNDVNNTGTQTRSGRSHVLLIGPSCESFDAQGRLVWCADNDLKIMRLEKDGTRTVMADNHDGKKFSGPNDLVIKSDGSIYFTDNDFGLRNAGKSPLKELPNGVWRIKDGETTRLLNKDQLGGVPNGIAFSTDEKFLYLSAGRTLKRYVVKPDGTLGDFTVFSEGPGIGDGIKVDTHGNVFSSGGAGPGIIRIVSPQGKFLGTLNLPIYGEEPKKQYCATNLVFGDPDHKSLYISGCDVVFRIRTKTEGVVAGPGK